MNPVERTPRDTAGTQPCQTVAALLLGAGGWTLLAIASLAAKVPESLGLVWFSAVPLLAALAAQRLASWLQGG